MAISRMKRVSIVAHSSKRKEIVDRLHDLGIVDIIDISDSKVEGDPDGVDARMEEADWAGKLNRIQSALNFISSYVKEGRSFIDSFFPQKLVVSSEERERIIREFDYEEFYQKCRKCEADLHEIRNRRDALEGQLTLLREWEDLPFTMDEIRRGTEKTRIVLGTLPTTNYEAALSDLSKLSEEFHAEVLSTKGGSMRVVVFVHREVADSLLNVLLRYDFEFESFDTQFEGTPREVASAVERDLAALEKRESEVLRRVGELASERDKLKVCYDYIAERKNALDIGERFLRTRSTFVVDGWIKEEDIESLMEAMGDFEESEVRFEDPRDDESVPVDFRNNRLLKPFELVTRLYSSPSYTRGIDPTPLIALPFALFFGICLTDAGYGIALVIMSQLILARKGIAEGAKMLLWLLTISGIVTVLPGALTGGWFGPDLIKFPLFAFLRKLVLFDPLAGQGPIIFLGVALSLGIIQIFVGLITKACMHIKAGEWIEAIVDKIVWVLFISFAIATIAISRKYLIGLLVSAVVVVLGPAIKAAAAKRGIRGILGGIGAGLYALYGSTGFLSDILSYSRLLALGMATGVIAMVINVLAKLVLGSPSNFFNHGMGIIFFAAVFFGGHLFNILINTLGGFIHTTRLQFVEFFPKFFESGGRAFSPFRREGTYTIVEEI
ncbi:MAG: V-type ATP synthase subunit I [bacterium]